MSHEINELAPGIHSFVSAREDAWHRLGKTLQDAFNAEEALSQAHLAGWDVRKINLTGSEITPDGVTTLEIPDRWASVYTNPITKQTQYLGVVGSHYQAIQNEAHVELLDALVDESGAKHFETAGSLRGGKEVFVTMRMPEALQIGGEDQVDVYLVAVNSHDGSSAFKFLVTPVRVVCANTLAAALGSSQASFSIRHTRGAEGKIQEAREALGLTWKYAQEFDAAAQRMISQAMTDSEFEKIARAISGMDATALSKRAETSALRNFEGLVSLWEGSETMTKIKGTRWAGYNAVTEYVDHFMDVRDTHGGDLDYARASRAVTNPKTIQFKERAFAAFSA